MRYYNEGGYLKSLTEKVNRLGSFYAVIQKYPFVDYVYLFSFSYLCQQKCKIMKTMTCKQLGGACNQTFSANTFDEIAMMVSKHAREMVQQGDAAHIEAMNDMRNAMTSPEAINTWMDEKRQAFNSLPNDK